MSYNDKASQWSITKETAYGDKSAPTLPADLVELIGPKIDPATDLLEREVLINSFVKAQPLLGKETCSGSMSVELSTATGAAGSKLVNGDLLYESAFGHRISDVAASGCSVSNGTVTFDSAGDVDNYEVGQAVKLVNGSTTEYAVVRSIDAGTSMVVAPTPSNSGTSCAGLVSFTVARPEATQISLAIQEYIEGTGRVEYTYGGVLATDVNVSFPVANIVKADFSLAGAGFTVKENGVNGATVADRDPVCFNFNPYVAKNMTFTYAGTSYDVAGLSLKVTSDVYDTEALTTEGLTNKTVTGKSAIGGSFDLEYTGTSLFSSFQQGTAGELFGVVSNANSTAVMFAPKVVLTSSSKAPESGIFKESIDYICLSSENCTANSEDAVTIGFE